MNANAMPRLGLAEAIERLGLMPEFLETAVESAAPGELVRRPGAGEFSLVEHACHLRDVERDAYLGRVRRLASEREPALAPFDGGAVAAERNYLAQDALRAAQDFSAARRELLGLLAALTEADLARAGTFGERRVCLADIVAMMVEHDREHRAQIDALLDFLEQD